MRRSLVHNLILVALFLAFFSGAVAIQRRTLEGVRKNPPFIETWNLSGRSGDILKILALRYDMVTADFLWLRAIQSFGGRGMTNRDWRPIYNLFDTITELDPYFEDAYTFGNLVIGDEGGKQREGLALIDKGMKNMICQYRVPFEGMYVAHWQMSDTNLARWYGRVAANRLNAPDWVPRIAAYVEVQGGAYYVGLDRFIGNFLRGIDGKDTVMQTISLSKIKDTIDDWNKSLLQRALDEYTSSTGRLPARIGDLVSQPALQNYESASISHFIAAINRYLFASGRDTLDAGMLKGYVLPAPDEMTKPVPSPEAVKAAKSMTPFQNEIFRDTLEKRGGIPLSPAGSPYMLNLTSLGNPYASRKEAVTDTANAAEFLKNLLGDMREVIRKRKNELGRNPESLREVFCTDFKTTEPFGGKFTYDPKTGEFKSSSHPDM